MGFPIFSSHSVGCINEGGDLIAQAEKYKDRWLLQSGSATDRIYINREIGPFDGNGSGFRQALGRPPKNPDLMCPQQELSVICAEAIGRGSLELER